MSGLGSAAGGKSTRNTAENASDNTTLSANSSDKSQVTKSLVTKTTADSPASSESFSGLNSEPTNAGSQPTGSKSAVHFVYSCSTSSRSVVERPSLTSEDGDEDIDDIDEDDDNDDDSCDSGAAGMPRIGQPSKQGDQALEEDVLRWRQRLVTSPPPRRTSHTPRRYEDHEKEPSSPGTDVTHSRSIPSDYSAVTDLETTPAESPKSPESSKHVSFDPFTLSLNAALEGELDVLQSLFSQVLLVRILVSVYHYFIISVLVRASAHPTLAVFDDTFRDQTKSCKARSVFLVTFAVYFQLQIGVIIKYKYEFIIL